jgi:hypothetical protein
VADRSGPAKLNEAQFLLTAQTANKAKTMVSVAFPAKSISSV